MTPTKIGLAHLKPPIGTSGLCSQTPLENPTFVCVDDFPITVIALYQL